MEYKEAVAEARQLVKRSEEDQWRLAQLTWEQLQSGISQERWAEDIGISRRSVRRIAAIWGTFGRAGLANRPNWTDAAAEVDAGTRTDWSRRVVREMPPEQKAQVASELLAEPEVVRSMPTEQKAAIANELATEPDVARHQNVVNREMQERAQQNYELREPRSVQIGANADMQYALSKARIAMADALEAADKLAAYGWPDESRRVAEVLVRRVSAGVELFQARIRGEDLDEELKALVENGGDL